jgi:hypothetical protein
VTLPTLTNYRIALVPDEESKWMQLKLFSKPKPKPSLPASSRKTLENRVEKESLTLELETPE